MIESKPTEKSGGSGGRILPILSMLILSCVLGACGADPSGPDQESDAVLPLLLGEWAWACSTGGLTGMTVCADSSGVTSTWKFRTDSLFQWVRNDTLVLSGPFRVVRESEPAGGDPLNRLVVNGAATIWSLEMPAVDRLEVLETCADCFSSSWTRVRE